MKRAQLAQQAVADPPASSGSQVHPAVAPEHLLRPLMVLHQCTEPGLQDRENGENLGITALTATLEMEGFVIKGSKMVWMCKTTHTSLWSYLGGNLSTRLSGC